MEHTDEDGSPSLLAPKPLLHKEHTDKKHDDSTFYWKVLMLEASRYWAMGRCSTTLPDPIANIRTKIDTDHMRGACA